MTSAVTIVDFTVLAAGTLEQRREHYKKRRLQHSGGATPESSQEILQIVTPALSSGVSSMMERMGYVHGRKPVSCAALPQDNIAPWKNAQRI